MYTTLKLQVLQHVRQTGYKKISIKIIFLKITWKIRFEFDSKEMQIK